MTDPIVSIIMPTYSQAWALPYALNSVAAQTYHDFELVVVDDASTDDTQSVLREWMLAHRDPRWDRPWVSRAINSGSAAAPINDGFRETTGPLVTWVSSDNLMSPHWLATLVPYFADPTVGVVYTAYWYTPVNGREQALAIAELPEPFQPLALVERAAGARVFYRPYAPQNQINDPCCFLGPSFLIRRDVWEAAGDHVGMGAHDLYHTLRLEEACWEMGLRAFVAEPKPLCIYFAHPERCATVAPEKQDQHVILRAAQERRRGMYGETMVPVEAT